MSLPRPDLKLEEATFIAFDTETTGLYPLSSRLVEIGASRFNSSGERVSVFEQLINPEMPIPPGAQAVNHITDEMVRGQPTVDRVMPAFIDFLDGLENILVAHNAPFDLEFIGVDILRLGLPLPGHMVFDTCLLAKAIMPGLASYSLASLAVLMGVASPQAHRALSDAELAGDVLLDLLRREPRIQTVEDLTRAVLPLTFEHVRVYQADPPARFESLTESIERRLPIEIVYAGGTKGAVPRKITPLAVLRYGGFIYLAAYCHLDGKEKMYRLDRIQSLRPAAS
jgi:DNA polymerase-3 subunit epsilon